MKGHETETHTLQFSVSDYNPGLSLNLNVNCFLLLWKFEQEKLLPSGTEKWD